MNSITNQIDEAIAATMKQISAAANKHDFHALEPLTKRASEFRAMKDQIIAIEHRFQHLTNGSQNTPTEERKDSFIRELIVEVTQGMKNQNLLTLTEYVNRGMVRVGEKFSIEILPSGEKFETELLPTGNKLQERGKIRKFYEEANVQAGDSVVLTEITPGRWQLKKLVRFRRVE